MEEVFEIDLSPDVTVKAEMLFRRLTPLLHELCPDGEVHHVGGTAIAGVPTKGDLDIQVRLPAEALESAALRVSEHYFRNDGGFNPPDGYSFEIKATNPPVGIHLTAIGGACDLQWVFTALLNENADLRARYGAIKHAYAGKSMDAYREAKARFFEELADLPRFAQIQRRRKAANSVAIRPFTSADAKAFLEIHSQAVREIASPDYPATIIDAWAPMITDSRIDRLRSDTEGLKLVAEQDGEMVGIGELVAECDELRACYVSPHHGRKGIGRAIVTELEALAKEAGCSSLWLGHRLINFIQILAAASLMSAM